MDGRNCSTHRAAGTETTVVTLDEVKNQKTKRNYVIRNPNPKQEVKSLTVTCLCVLDEIFDVDCEKGDDE
jgi:hypothetical protein